jgi:hypothetical protein
MPKLTKTLCADKYRSAIEAVIVEGHSDSAPYRGATAEESQARNLKLSQERSMEVVEKTLASLSDQPGLRNCLLEKISASGRGEQDLAETADKSRRAVIKVRVNATHALDVANAILAERSSLPAEAPPPSAAATKILDLLSRLKTLPPQPVSFRLYEEEVNQYLAYALLISPRPGIDSIRLKFFPHDYLSTLTVIDFDAIERWSPGLVPGLFGLTGKKAIWIDVRFSIDRQMVSYKVEKAFYQERQLPAFLAEKLIRTLGARQPENAGGQEMPVPFGLRRVETGEHYVQAGN